MIEDEKNMKYNDYILHLSKKFIRTLDDISGIYGFDYGNEFEVALCYILRDFLPNKYGICRGFVVSSDGEIAGDDIIIFDQERFPTLQLKGHGQYARKEQIPIEAVYAYIEAKHSIDLEQEGNNSIFKAVKQVENVKILCGKREKINISQLDPYLPDFINVNEISIYPSYRNPVLGIIVSRYVEIKGKKEYNVDRIYEILQKVNLEENDYSPDLLICGDSHYITTGYSNEKISTETLFRIDRKNNFYVIHKKEKMSYGLLLAHLFAAIDYIRLGKMPWLSMINEIL